MLTTCNSCGVDVMGASGRCRRCGSPIGEEDHDPDVYIVRNRLDDPDAMDSRGQAGDGAVAVVPVISAWKAGPSSFGPVGRLSLTAVVLALGYLLYLGALSAGAFYGTVGLALIMLMIGCFMVLALMFLWGLWRPTRVK
jgi:hypothetical protein